MNPKPNNSIISTSTTLNMEEDDNQSVSSSSCESGSGIDLENLHPTTTNTSHMSRDPNLDEKSSNFMSLVHHKWRKMWRRDYAEITPSDPSYKTVYLGNVVTTWAKGQGCLERPASALWKNHCQGRGSIKMLISVAPSGLKAQTREHGLTEYWANRLTWCGVPPDYPKLFCWIYRHEGRKLKQELRCHAVLCSKEVQAQRLANSLKNRLTEALFDFKKEKILRQNARLSIVQSLYNTSATKRKLVLMNSNSQNYKPPLERSKSAPKLSCIEEFEEDDDDENEENEENFTDSQILTIIPRESQMLPLGEEDTEFYPNGSTLIHAEESSTDPSAVDADVDNRLAPPLPLPHTSPIIISHRKSYPTTTNGQIIHHHPEGGINRRPHTVPMDAKLNLPYMTGYDKVMHLLDMPPGGGNGDDTHHTHLLNDEDVDDDQFSSYAGQNSDPVASSPGSDSSSCEDDYGKGGGGRQRRRGSTDRRKRSSDDQEEDREDEINDNVSDESGYSEEAVIMSKRGGGGNNSNIISTSVDERVLNMDPKGSSPPNKSSTKNLSKSTIIITGNNEMMMDRTDSRKIKTSTSTTTTFKSDEHGGTTATTLVVYDNLCFEI